MGSSSRSATASIVRLPRRGLRRRAAPPRSARARLTWLAARSRAASGSRATDRCASTASASAATPSPVEAVVTSTGGGLRSMRPPAEESIARSWRAARSAPGRSPLLTTTMSATSRRPALMACTSSPISGTSTTTVVSARRATSTSDWPAPTVSTRIGSNPAASSAAAASQVVGRQAAELAARRHRAHEDVAVGRVIHHPDAVAEDRAARVRRRRVHGQDADPPAPRTPLADEPVDERRLAAPRGPGDADDVGAMSGREQLRKKLPGRWIAVLDPRQQPGQRPALAGRQRLDSVHAPRRACSRK